MGTYAVIELAIVNENGKPDTIRFSSDNYQNYSLFALLANVRNGTGFETPSDGSYVTPLPFTMCEDDRGTYAAVELGALKAAMRMPILKQVVWYQHIDDEITTHRTYGTHLALLDDGVVASMLPGSIYPTPMQNKNATHIELAKVVDIRTDIEMFVNAMSLCALDHIDDSRHELRLRVYGE